MTLHLSHILEECQPRIAIMTGICAGDAEHVQLGDLVVAERTFPYDNGKFTLDEYGRSVHEHDTLTYQLDANILQFLGLFDDWKPLIMRLERPPSPPEIRLERREVHCHIKAMASGNAVRADNPFEDVRAPVRGTVAIDMEGAAFGLVMSRHPLIPWLIVKGVCDYADRDKNDTYHDYAARASALYVLNFIRAYVTNERLPQLDRPTPSSRAGSSGVWKISHLRNSHLNESDDLRDGIEKSSHRITRRRVILGLGLAGLALAGGGVAWLAVAGDHAISSSHVTPPPRLSPLPLGERLYKFSGHTQQIRGIAWSPDGGHIASGSWDNTVRVWEVAEGGHVYVYPGHFNAVYTVAWSPDGRRIASAGYDQTVQVWDAKNGGNVYIYPGHSSTVRGVVWSPDSKRIASGDEKSVQVWDAKNGGNVYIYRKHTALVISVAWSPDGKRIASGSGDKTVQVWDAKDGSNTYVYHGHIAPVFAVGWSWDGKLIASAGVDRTVQVWGAG